MYVFLYHWNEYVKFVTRVINLIS